MFIPNYYNKFRCISSLCRHNCCIGWEIDIDEDTLGYYKSLRTPLGEKILNSISADGEAHFILSDGERCPHLNENNLCDIICELGEGALCQICSEHPRFYNYFEGFTEAGIGLCCEEAARIILGEKDKFTIISQDDNAEEITHGEQQFLNQRQRIFDILCDRSCSIKARFSRLCELYGFCFEAVSSEAIIRLYSKLERLDEAWTVILSRLDGYICEFSILEDNNYALYFENLACYFIYRHLADGLYEGNIPQRVMFALSACLLLALIFNMQLKEKGTLSFEEICEYARMFSSEVEYSEENTQSVLCGIINCFKQI